jgi:hypothetical protein
MVNPNLKVGGLQSGSINREVPMDMRYSTGMTLVFLCGLAQTPPSAESDHLLHVQFEGVLVVDLWVLILLWMCGCYKATAFSASPTTK